MANVRRHGNIVGLWGTLAADGQTPVAETVQAGQYSRPQFVGQFGGDLALYLSSSLPTTITLYAAHSSQLTSEGSDPGRVAPPFSQFYPVFSSDPNLIVNYSFTGAGNVVILVPRFAPGWIMLKTTGGGQIYAGWELATV